MANRERGEVALEIDGKTYTLRLDVEAMCSVETLFSTSEHDVVFQDVINRIQKGSVRHLRGLIWATLQGVHPEITLRDTSRWINSAGGLAGLNSSLMQLADSTRPDSVDKKAVGKSVRPPRAQRLGAAGNGAISTSHPDA